MPRPVKGETVEHFVARYVGSPEARAKYPKTDQRVAIAYSIAGEGKRRRSKR